MDPFYEVGNISVAAQEPKRGNGFLCAVAVGKQFRSRNFGNNVIGNAGRLGKSPDLPVVYTFGYIV